MLEQAVALARAGNKEGACKLLRQIVAQDPYNEHAWGWLAACAKTKEERIAALKRVVEINPDNDGAQRALEKITGRELKSQQPAHRTQSSPTANAHKPLAQPAEPQSASDKQDRVETTRPRRAPSLVKVALVSGVVLTGIAVICVWLFVSRGTGNGDSNGARQSETICTDDVLRRFGRTTPAEMSMLSANTIPGSVEGLHWEITPRGDRGCVVVLVGTVNGLPMKDAYRWYIKMPSGKIYGDSVFIQDGFVPYIEEKELKLPKQ